MTRGQHSIHRAGLAALTATMLLSSTACGQGDSDSSTTQSPGDSSSSSPCSTPTETGAIGECGPGGASGGQTSRQQTTDGRATDGQTPAPPAPAGKAGTVRVGASGDILTHVPVMRNGAANARGKGYDFTPMFAAVKEKVSALDVAICHLETPLSKDNTALTIPNTMVFNAPHEMADALKDSGFDGCDRVGNHMMDRGVKGIASTRDSLDAAGLKQQGPTAESTDHQQAVVYQSKGFTIAHLAYSYTSQNQAASNTDLPPGAEWVKHWQFPVAKAEGILADARRAKEAGADFVVLSMHWGAEYSSQSSPEQEKLAKELLTHDDVDLILGTHVHVAQPCEKINGKYVVYGMGNFLSNQGPASHASLKPATQDGMIVDVALTRGEDGKVSSQLVYQPTHVNLANHHIELATKTQHPEAYQRITWAMGQLGGRCDAKPAG